MINCAIGPLSLQHSLEGHRMFLYYKLKCIQLSASRVINRVFDVLQKVPSKAKPPTKLNVALNTRQKYIGKWFTLTVTLRCEFLLPFSDSRQNKHLFHPDESADIDQRTSTKSQQATLSLLYFPTQVTTGYIIKN